MIRLLLLSIFAFFASDRTELSVDFTTTAPEKGKVRIAVYADEAAYSAEKPTYYRIIDVKGAAGKVQLELDDFTAGNYVVAGYHDVNGNGKLDKNLIGAPSEPYGFVRMPESKWSAPAWEEIITPLKTGKQTVEIKFRTWKEW